MSLESPNYYYSDQVTALRFDIKDAASHLGIAPSTLRYWEREGLIFPERNDTNDYRRYSPHNLIDASEIAFYRQLGVPIKELKSYHGFTIDQLDETLARTEESIERRIAELEASRERLATQRALNAQAETLRSVGMRPRTPNLDRLVAIEYDNPLHWMLFVDEPWHYGLFIDAADPDTAIEGLAERSAAHANEGRRSESTAGKSMREKPVFQEKPALFEKPALPDESIGKTASDKGPSPSLVLWERRSKGQRQPSLECLLRIAAHGNASNAGDLLEKASQRGINPTAIVATYLVTGTETSDGPRWDYYHAWVVGGDTR